MFEQSFTDTPRGPQGWSFAASVVAQLACLGGMILVPLLNTYEIDLGAWARLSFFLAAPPPPAPPPPRAEPVPQVAPTRYEADFRAPSVIPEQVAILNDVGTPLSPIAGMPAPSGPAGGIGDPSTAGVLGMFPTAGRHLPLPPPIRVGGRIQNARILQRVMPVYPPDAVEMRVMGTVKLEAIIGIDGNVRNVRLLEGHPLLVPAAVEAVTQWKYRPTRLNGRIVEVVTLIDVNFNLTVPSEKELRQLRRQANRSAGSR